MLISEQLNQSRQLVQQQQVSIDSIKFIDHLPLILFFLDSSQRIFKTYIDLIFSYKF